MPEEDMSGRVCVLGVGNTLLGDEGFGVRAMEYLRDNYVWPGNVDFVDGGTQGMGLMLMKCDLMGCRPETFVVGFEPYDYSRMNLDLTPEAGVALPSFCDKAAQVIRERGFASPVRKN